MTPIRITDPEDPRIEPFRDIRERDLVGRRGLFIAEGSVVLRLMLRRSRHALLSVLVAERHLEGLGHLLRDLPDEVPLHVATQPVMDRVAGFAIHRGVLGLGRRADPGNAASLLAAAGAGGPVVALIGIANHDNMGGIFRNAAAFGAAAILLDETCCDPLYRKAIRVSVGAALVVPFARLPADAMLAALADAGFRTLAFTPSGGRGLAGCSTRPRVALLFGSEGAGLPETVLDRVETVRIPIGDSIDSLNVATAAGIALHHFAGPVAQPAFIRRQTSSSSSSDR